MAFISRETFTGATGDFDGLIAETLTVPGGATAITLRAHLKTSAGSAPTRDSSILPATADVGGVSVAINIETRNVLTESPNTAAGIYHMDATDVGSMSGSDVDIDVTHGETQYILTADYWDDGEDVVATGFSSSTNGSQTTSLSGTASGDIILGATSERADRANPTTADTEDYATNSGGTTSLHVKGLGTSEVATGDPTVHATGTSADMGCMCAIAIRPAGAGGGAGSVTRKIVAVVGVP
jgi:hypothetical protein